MKTKLPVQITYKTESGKNSVATKILIPKLNYVEGSGALKNTLLELGYERRLTRDDLDLMVSERPGFKITPNKEMTVVCEVEAYKSFNANGKANYWLVVTFSEHVKRPFTFNPTQKLNIANCKYPFEFEEVTKDDPVYLDFEGQLSTTTPVEDKPAPTKK